VHVAVSEPFVAVTVTFAPTTKPASAISGVESLVTSSEFDEPVSEAAIKSGVIVGAVITASALDALIDVIDPVELVAVTAKRRYEPNMSDVGVMEREFAFAMAVQSFGTMRAPEIPVTAVAVRPHSNH
jgi:hypothetical protein